MNHDKQLRKTSLVVLAGALLFSGIAFAADEGGDDGQGNGNGGFGNEGQGNNGGNPGNGGGDPGAIIGGGEPPVFQNPGPIFEPPAPSPEPMPPSGGGRHNQPDPGNDFTFTPQMNLPIISAQPQPSLIQERSERTRQGGATYESGSSIIFKSADQVTDEKKTFGMAPETRPSSSMQQMFVGTIVAIDRNKNQVVLKDRYRHTKAFFVDASVTPTLRKGTVIQTTFLPGNSKADRVQHIVG